MVKVLVIKPSSLGDIIHSAEGVERLARARPDCELDWLVNAEYADFVREFPGVREVVPFARQRFRAGRAREWIPAASSLFARLRRRYDVAIDLQGLQRSGLMTRSTAARERWGLASARELAWLHYNRRVELPADLPHAIDRILFVVDRVLEGSAYLRSANAPSAPFRLPVPAWARERAATHLGDDPRPLLVICPGARWRSKLWPARRWGELLSLLAPRRDELRTLFLGAPGEESLFLDACSEASRHGVDASFAGSLIGKAAIWTTAAFFERASVAFTMDSAPLHLAAAVGAATVSLFGPTDPARVAPRGEEHTILTEDLECLRCYRRECPLPERVCLPGTGADRVLHAIDAALARRASIPVASRRDDTDRSSSLHDVARPGVSPS